MDTYAKKQTILALASILQSLATLPLYQQIAACRDYLASERLSRNVVNDIIKSAFLLNQ